MRHCLDVMHIEKNVCYAILATLMNIPNRTKDVKAAQKWFELKGLRPELWPQSKKSKKRKKDNEEGEGEKGKTR